jgi:hypothetical protein
MATEKLWLIFSSWCDASGSYPLKCWVPTRGQNPCAELCNFVIFLFRYDLGPWKRSWAASMGQSQCLQQTLWAETGQWPTGPYTTKELPWVLRCTHCYSENTYLMACIVVSGIYPISYDTSNLILSENDIICLKYNNGNS